jgi:hypothetical protein
MEAMLAYKKEAHKNTANTGRLFLYISVLILIGFIILSFA